MSSSIAALLTQASDCLYVSWSPPPWKRRSPPIMCKVVTPASRMLQQARVGKIQQRSRLAGSDLGRDTLDVNGNALSDLIQDLGQGCQGPGVFDMAS